MCVCVCCQAAGKRGRDDGRNFVLVPVAVSEIGQVIVSRRMVTDHLLTSYEAALRDADRYLATQGGSKDTK